MISEERCDLSSSREDQNAAIAEDTVTAEDDAAALRGDCSDPAERFELAVRTRAAQHSNGPCVLDVCEQNMKNFSGFSSSALAEADLHRDLPDDAAAVLACLEQHHKISAAFGVRRELVNFKKVCLHVLQEAIKLEKELRLYATYFFADLVNGADPDERDRYIGITHTLSTCRGALVAMQDAREFTKMICALPRHPEAPHEQGGLLLLPGSLGLYRMMEKACLFLDRQVPSLCPEMTEEQYTQHGAPQLILSVHSLQLPPWVVNYVGKVCIARGVCKATRARGRLAQLVMVFTQILIQLHVLRAELAAQHVDLDQVKRSMHHRMHTDLIAGAIPVAEEVLNWLSAILEPSDSSLQLFVASDASDGSGGAAFLPETCHLTRLFEMPRAETIRLRAELEGAEWPPANGRAKGKHGCKTCGGSFSRAYVSREVCWRCEVAERESGRCPFGCNAGLFCSHAQRCVVCDLWSCDECELHVGDGMLVQALVQRHAPAVLFLDFDHTLCSTRNGELPIPGKHCLDTQLQAVAAEHSNVVVVTRNSHTEAIAEMLSTAGLSDVQIFSVGARKATDKAGILGNMELWRSKCTGEDLPTALFVDDDIRELTAEHVASLSPQLKRVLFRR